MNNDKRKCNVISFIYIIFHLNSCNFPFKVLLLIYYKLLVDRNVNRI